MENDVFRRARSAADVRRRRRALYEDESGKLLNAAKRRPAEQYLKTQPAASSERLGQLRQVGRERDIGNKAYKKLLAEARALDKKTAREKGKQDLKNMDAGTEAERILAILGQLHMFLDHPSKINCGKRSPRSERRWS